VLIRTTASSAEAAVMLVVWANHKTLRAPIRAFLESSPKPTGFFLNINDRPGPFMVGRETIRIDGRSHVREDVLGTKFLISPTAFFQTNVLAARELVTLVLDRVGGARRVLDLYSGTGLFAMPLAARDVSVVAVEENRAAVKDAEQNLRLNRIDPRKVRLISARVEDALERIPASGFDAVVLDPPRQGCPENVLSKIAGNIRPARIVYVSCNPERLAVERTTLERAGYTMSSLQGLDMFPHTEHIEAIGVWDR
jgi:23S rRNA (uracil1939-C5)-methyltransferase